MTSRIRTIGTAVLLSSVTVVLLAQTPIAPALDIKMGLWEISSTSQIGGNMPTMDTSKMTPEQKAQMEAAMKAMMGSHQNVTKSCMTKEKFQKEGLMEDHGGDCKQSITTNTKSTLEAKVVCTNPSSTSQFHVDAQSQTAFKATVKTVATDQGKPMNIDIALTGKWLGADCGDVK
jgi:hypothetical protein